MVGWLGVVLLVAPPPASPPPAKFEEHLTYEGRRLREWLNDLRDGSPADQRRASRALRAVGPEAHAAVPALLMRLRSDDSTIRGRVAAALARAGPRQTPLFTAALSFDEPRLVYGSARVLGLLGPPARAAVPALRRQLQSPTPDVRIHAALALWRIDRRTDGLAVLRDEMRGPTANQQWAAWALEQFGPAAAPAAAELVAALASGDDQARADAAAALVAIGPAAVPELVKALTSTSAGQRVEVAETLGRIGPAATAAVDALAAGLRDPQPGPAAAAARALGRVGVPSEAAVSALRRGVVASDADVRFEAARALAVLAPRAAVPELRLALRDETGRVRRAAVDALARIGKPAVPALVELVNDSDHLVRRQALLALRDIGPDAAAAVPALTAALKQPGAAVRLAAVEALAAVGAPGVAALVVALGDGETRLAAARALARLGPQAAPARTALVEALREKDPVLRQAAAAALGSVGPAARDVVPALVKVAGEDATGRAEALTALRHLQPAARDVLPLARAALKDDRDSVRLAAVALLQQCGADAAPAVLEGRPLLDGGLPVRRAAAAWLIGRGETKAVADAAQALLGHNDPAHRAAGLQMAARLGKDGADLRPAVRARLRDADPDCRVRAALACWRAEQSAPVDDLLGLLQPATRKRAGPAACRVLARLGPRGRAAVGPLVAIVKDKSDLELRLEAARALGAIGPDAAAALPALFGLLLDVTRLPDEWSDVVADAVTTGAGRHTDLPTTWGQENADLTRAVRAAQDAVRKDGRAALPGLRDALTAAADRLEADVLDAIAAVGPAAAVLARQDLAHDSREVQTRGARVLARLGRHGRDAADALGKLASSAHPDLAVEAARALHAVAGDGTRQPALLRGLTESAETAARAARALGEIGADTIKAAPALAAALRRPEPPVRRAAAAALGRLRPGGKPIREALQERLRDADALTRLRAAAALGDLGADVDLPGVLFTCLRDATDRPTRLEALAGIEQLGDKGKSALHLLRALCDDADAETSLAAARVVWKVSGDVGPSRRVAAAVAGRPDVRSAVRLAALRTLTAVAADARPLLLDLLDDPATPPEVARTAAELLANRR